MPIKKKQPFIILVVILPILVFGQNQLNELQSEKGKVAKAETVQAELYDINAIAKGGNAQWSPDGKRIAFLTPKSPGIWIISSDGKGDATQLTFERLQDLAWSPDSREIAFRTREKEQEWLKIVNVETGEIRTIYGPYDAVLRIRWLEDGNIGFFERGQDRLDPEWIVLDRFGKVPKKITSSEKVVYDVISDILYVMNADGTEKKRLLWAEKPKVHFLWPVWSGIAKKIAVKVISDSSYLMITDENGITWQSLIYLGAAPQ
jgi:dipeptidyl aminopeptidase/acylaminoacyl peptidase